jgi:hypothetical protein
MTKFTDGPAAGQSLLLRRTPKFLRVTYKAGREQEWDALDQLDDHPEPGEVLHCYRLVRSEGTIHLNMRDRRGRHCGGTFRQASYEYVEQQPAAEVMESNMAWRKWCEAQVQSEQISE